MQTGGGRRTAREEWNESMPSVGRDQTHKRRPYAAGDTQILARKPGGHGIREDVRHGMGRMGGSRAIIERPAGKGRQGTARDGDVP